jgi:hypothetical protein
MIKLIVTILVIFWALGFVFHIAGSLIHLVLVVAVVLLIANLLGIGKKSV